MATIYDLAAAATRVIEAAQAGGSASAEAKHETMNALTSVAVRLFPHHSRIRFVHQGFEFVGKADDTGSFAWAVGSAPLLLDTDKIGSIETSQSEPQRSKTYEDEFARQLERLRKAQAEFYAAMSKYRSASADTFDFIDRYARNLDPVYVHDGMMFCHRPSMGVPKSQTQVVVADEWLIIPTQTLDLVCDAIEEDTNLDVSEDSQQ